MSTDRSLLTALAQTHVLQTKDFQQQHIGALANACSLSEQKLIRKVAAFFAQFFGILSAKLVLDHIQSKELKEKFTEQILRCRRIYDALKEGKDLKEISKLDEVKQVLSKVFAIESDPAEEIVQREISLCLHSLPMAALDSSFIISKCIPAHDIVLLREKALSLAKCLYDFLDKKTPLHKFSEEQLLEIESFCHRGWGFTQSNYISWLTIILQWQARSTQTEHVQTLLDRFRFPRIRNQIPGTPTLSIPFRQYSIKLTLDILGDRIKIEIPDVIREVLAKELFRNELLRQEIFLWPSTTTGEKPTKYGSPKFNEILECIGRVSLLQMKNGCIPLVLEWIYFADLETKLKLDLLLHRKGFSQEHFELCTKLILPFRHKKYPEMKLIVLLYEHPETKDICDAAVKGLEKNIPHFDQLVFYFLQRFIPASEFSSYEEIYHFLENVMTGLGCSDTFSKCIFDMMVLIKKDPHKKELVTDFVNIFRKLDRPLSRETIFRAMLRFVQGAFTLENIQGLGRLDCFVLTPADQVELFSEVLPSFPDKNHPQFSEYLQFSMTLSSKYKFSIAETCRLFLQFFSFNLQDLQVFYKYLISLESFVKAQLKSSFVFDLFYSNPIRTTEAFIALEAMITSATFERRRIIDLFNQTRIDFRGQSSLPSQCVEYPDMIQRLVNLRNDGILPLYSENWIQFMNIEGFDDENPILSPLVMPLSNTFFLVNTDLPLGRIMLCRWCFKRSFYFEMFLLDPVYLEARSCKFYLDISFREKSQWNLLYRLAEFAGQEKPLTEKEFKSQLGKIVKENQESNKILHFIEQIKKYYRFHHLSLMETRQEVPPKVFEKEHIIYSTNKHPSGAIAHPYMWPGDPRIRLPQPVMEKLPYIVKSLQSKQDISLNSLGVSFKLHTHTDAEYQIFWSFNPENKNEVLFKILTAEIAWCYGDMIDHPYLENIVQLHLLMILSHHYEK